MSAQDQLTLGEHLSELKRRLFISSLCIAIGAILSYFYSEQILSFLIRPLGGPLYYTTPTGGFDLVFKTSLLSGVFIASPILVYHMLKFFEPVIPHGTARTVRYFLFFSWMLLIAGTAVAYYFSLPAALKLLSEFGSTRIKAIISTKDYFSFILAYLGGFGLIFQLPIVMLLVHRIRPLSPKILMKYLRHVILVSFITAAILTPTPDPINQIIMAAPTVLLYVLTIGIISFQKKPKLALQENFVT